MALHTNRRIGFLSYGLLVLIVVIMIAFLDWIVRRSLRPLQRALIALSRLTQKNTTKSYAHGQSIVTNEMAILTQSLRTFKRTRDSLSATQAARQRAEQELELARHIQSNFVPHHFPPFPHRNDFDLHALMRPAKAVGGDMYDFFLLDERRLFFMIGDVSDKGFASAFFMAIARTALKIAVQSAKTQPLAQVMRQVNHYLAMNNPSQMFVTLVAGILDTATGLVEMCDAGHDPPLLIDVSNPATFIDKRGGMAMGFDPDYPYESWTYRLQSGQGLVLYTDGITEAVAQNGDMYGSERLLQTLGRPCDLNDPRALIAHLYDSVLAFTHGTVEPADDATMLVLTIGKLGTHA